MPLPERGFGAVGELGCIGEGAYLEQRIVVQRRLRLQTDLLHDLRT